MAAGPQERGGAGDVRRRDRRPRLTYVEAGPAPTTRRWARRCPGAAARHTVGAAKRRETIILGDRGDRHDAVEAAGVHRVVAIASVCPPRRRRAHPCPARAARRSRAPRYGVPVEPDVDYRAPWSAAADRLDDRASGPHPWRRAFDRQQLDTPGDPVDAVVVVAYRADDARDGRAVRLIVLRRWVVVQELVAEIEQQFCRKPG